MEDKITPGMYTEDRPPRNTNLGMIRRGLTVENEKLRVVVSETPKKKKYFRNKGLSTY